MEDLGVGSYIYIITQKYNIILPGIEGVDLLDVLHLTFVGHLLISQEE
jgi:hypothetical protein